MIKNIKFLFFIFLGLLVLIIGLLLFYSSSSSIKLPTYFSYTEKEKNLLNSYSSNQLITINSLTKWDGILFNLIKENKLGDAPASKVYAYLYTAQRDAAFLSKNIKNTFMGSIDVISAKTLCLFFQAQCADLKSQAEKSVDPYSETLANIVLDKVQARMTADKKKYLSLS